MVAAFGIAPDTRTENITRQQVTQEIVLSAIPRGAGDDGTYWREERIQRGDTVGSLLARLQVQDGDASAFLRASREARSLYQLVPGRTVRAVTTGDGRLVSLRYLNPNGRELTVRRQQDGFAANEEQPDQQRQLMMASGEIETSLFAATDAAGLSDGVATQLADIFSSEVDFHRDLQPGDRFAVVYEAIYSNGEFLRTGRILAAEFVNRGLTYRALYYQDEHGQDGYYTPTGKNMRKTFLRSPLEFSRITSGFSTARLHPVLNVMRAHKGVDYGAPVGTRVRATADGVVQLAGARGGYGNVVVLQHRNTYATLYAHLSAIPKGLHPGQRVSQGDIIGFVGMSGLATGPHLHYEFLVNGVHVDPQLQPMPQGAPITREMRAAFEQASQPLLERLELMRNTNLALVN